VMKTTSITECTFSMECRGRRPAERKKVHPAERQRQGALPWKIVEKRPEIQQRCYHLAEKGRYVEGSKFIQPHREGPRLLGVEHDGERGGGEP